MSILSWSCSLQLMFVLFSILSFSLQASEPPLTLNYYESNCPNVLEIVRKEMECAVLSDPRNAALILRLHFHDCFVQVSVFLFFIKVTLFKSNMWFDTSDLVKNDKT